MDKSVDLLGMRRLAFVLASEAGLTRDDRLDLAEVLLRRDVGSWKELDVDDLARLLDALKGYQFIAHLSRTRPPQPAGTATS